MKEKKINFIGAGNLGKTIARLIVMNDTGFITGICNASFESSLNAVKFIQAGIACDSFEKLPPSDITFITVPDDKIADVCAAYSLTSNFNTSGIIIHCSGLLTSDVLVSAKQKGCEVISVHPMRSFSDPILSVQKFSGTYCAIECNVSQNTKALIFNLFHSIGAKTMLIDPRKKAAYHAAGVIASNYLITIADTAKQCLKHADIKEEEATDIVLNLMEGTLVNLIKTRSPEKSLTGPIKRGDIKTIEKHLSTLNNESIKKAYVALGELTLNLTCHDQDTKTLIKDALYHNIRNIPIKQVGNS